MATALSRQKAAQAWTRPGTEHINMIPELAEAFAEILDEVWPDALIAQVDELEAKINALATRREG